jgi:hypothetical protein
MAMTRRLSMRTLKYLLFQRIGIARKGAVGTPAALTRLTDAT